MLGLLLVLRPQREWEGINGCVKSAGREGHNTTLREYEYCNSKKEGGTKEGLCCDLM